MNNKYRDRCSTPFFIRERQRNHSGSHDMPTSKAEMKKLLYQVLVRMQNNWISHMGRRKILRSTLGKSLTVSDKIKHMCIL